MSAVDPRAHEWHDDVLDFWFTELGEANWFVKNPELDTIIQDRFGQVHERLMRDDGIDVEQPRPVLAAVIVLDQFSRNMFRGTPRAFASDPLARRLAGEAIDRGLDRELATEQRLFLYMPFEHSEDRADQVRAVELIRPLGNENWTLYAEAHAKIVERFGRFPHRNAILGRTSTPEELELLKDPMGSF